MSRPLRDLLGDSQKISVADVQPLLLFLPTSTYRVGVIMNVPLDTPEANVFKGIMFRGNYVLPSNSSRVGAASEVRTTRETRWVVYNFIEHALDRLGVQGRACVRRAVCEAARAGLSHDGLLGRLLHVLLTPSSSNERAITRTQRQYERAEQLGRVGGDCDATYAQCFHGALDLFTTLGPS